jgi:hypothetical protein
MGLRPFKLGRPQGRAGTRAGRARIASSVIRPLACSPRQVGPQSGDSPTPTICDSDAMGPETGRSRTWTSARAGLERGVITVAARHVTVKVLHAPVVADLARAWLAGRVYLPVKIPQLV